jgi:hypothetical protein
MEIVMYVSIVVINKKVQVIAYNLLTTWIESNPEGTVLVVKTPVIED